MATLDSFLEESLHAWRHAREGIIDEVRNIPEDKLDFRPTPEVKDVRELVQHILEVSMMMTGELTRTDTDFRRAPWPELLAMYASPASQASTKQELLDVLASQMDEAENAFRGCGVMEMRGYIDNFDGSRGTKMQWLHHGIAQEMYHRGQLTLYARLMGLEPALTKRIEAG